MTLRAKLMFLDAFILVLSCAAIIYSQNKPNSSNQIMSELSAVHSELSAAIESGDKSRVRAFYAPHFMTKLPNGRFLTLDDIDRLSQLVDTPEAVEREHTTVIKKLKVVGPDAILSVDHSSSITYKLKDGSIRRIVELIKQQETWTKLGDNWKLAVIEDIEQKQREVTLNGTKVDAFVPDHSVPLSPNPDDESNLNSGFGIIFIYRMKDGAVIKPPIYCNDKKVAQMTGGSFLKLKLQPATYSVKSDKGDPIDVVVKAGEISILVLKMEVGFPKGRGRLQMDRSVIAAQAYKVPKLLELTPLGNDNIFDASKVITSP